MLAFKKSGVRGLTVTGVVLAALFYAKDLYDLWCITTGSNPLGPSWGNHSLVVLGFVVTSVTIVRRKQSIGADNFRPFIVVLVVLLLDVILDVLQDLAHFL